MVHSHHSHSGEYVSHATSSLEEVVNRALSMNFQTFCLTEHAPRYESSTLYPEEIEKRYTTEDLLTAFNSYYKHALEIKSRVNSDQSNRTKILIGFEAEGGIDDYHLQKAYQLKLECKPDVVVGSVHHLDGIPIDLDRESWIRAKGDDSFRDYFLRYFKQLRKMIIQLAPEVIGHFDLIRLLLDPDDRCELTNKLISEVNIESDWPEVWSVINETIDIIIEQGGLIELNSAALRKGWDTPYPKTDIILSALQKGGKFCLSDDSHGVKQVGLNYDKVLKFLNSLSDFKEIYYWDLSADGKKFINSLSLHDLSKDDFWLNYY